MRLLNFSVANTAKTAEQAAAILQFLFLGVGAAAVYFAVQSLRRTTSDMVSGLVLGALVGLPLASISAGIGQSSVRAGWVSRVSSKPGDAIWCWPSISREAWPLRTSTCAATPSIA